MPVAMEWCDVEAATRGDPRHAMRQLPRDEAGATRRDCRNGRDTTRTLRGRLEVVGKRWAGGGQMVGKLVKWWEVVGCDVTFGVSQISAAYS